MNAAVGILLALTAQSSGHNRTLQLEMRPSGDPQIAVWLEDVQGTFVDTLMVTRLTGTFGLGNRPGRPDFGGGYLWPYGRREMVLPVWAHRRGVEYPRLVFQDCREDSLGWHERHSSEEPFYCRPLTSQEQQVDAVTCPTTRFSSDKGVPMDQVDTSNPLCRSLTERYAKTTSPYPPRNDLNRVDPNRDWSGLDQLDQWNELDAVSQATPPSGELYRKTWRLPSGLADGEYTVWVEVNQAFDSNDSHDYAFFVDPMLANYGVRVVGQPSVLWRVPVSIGPSDATVFSAEHAGYGSPDGQDGLMRPLDGSITTGVEGTGAGRLLPIQGEQGAFQVKVRLQAEEDGGTTCNPPLGPVGISALSADWQGVDLMVEMAPQGDGVRYEVRFAEGHDAIVDEGDYVAAVPGPQLEPSGAATGMAVRLDMPRTQFDYTVAIRAFNDCGEASDFVTLNVGTERREFQSIDACFVATAAHGARYAEEVTTLRSFRDEVLVPSDTGLTAVELYYYVSPPIADAIRDNSTLRAATRIALKPLVWLADKL